MVHACEVANEAEREIGIWRASIFNELFEAALQKEGPPVKPGPDTSTPSRGSHLAKKQKQKRRQMTDVTQKQDVMDVAQQTKVIDLTVDAVLDSHLGPGGLARPAQPDPE